MARYAAFAGRVVLVRRVAAGRGSREPPVACACRARSGMLPAIPLRWKSLARIYCSGRYRLVIGSLRSRPNARSVTLTPGAAWRRLYSAASTIPTTRRATL
jgi:hypothetical protein